MHAFCWLFFYFPLLPPTPVVLSASVLTVSCREKDVFVLQNLMEPLIWGKHELLSIFFVLLVPCCVFQVRDHCWLLILGKNC